MIPYVFQQEQRHAVREDILHARAVNAALHGRVGKAVVLEVGYNITSYSVML